MPLTLPEIVFACDRATVSLDRLPLGRSGTIVTVTGDVRLRRRLLEMGLCSDTEIMAIRRAPLGDPIEFRLRGYFLSLRRDQAAQVVVSLTASAS